MPKNPISEPIEQVAITPEPAALPVPIPRQSVEADAIPLTRNAGEHERFLVRVISPEGKLLFCYNARTDAVEIRNSRGFYSVSLKDMRSIALSRFFSPEPGGDIILDESGVGQTTYNPPLSTSKPSAPRNDPVLKDSWDADEGGKYE